MKKAILTVALLAPMLASVSWAQTPMRNRAPEGFKYMPSKEVEALTSQPGPGAKTAFPVDHENYFLEYAERNDKGNEAEVHAHWTHYIHVLSGEATLIYGGTVTSPRESGPGQVRGPGIAGGTSMMVHIGDFVQIPAGMPHLFNVAAGGKFRYLVFNGRE
jgi:quercetin dioxygenase-like cupin family protein